MTASKVAPATYIASKNVPTILAAILDKSAPCPTDAILSALLDRFTQRKERATKRTMSVDEPTQPRDPKPRQARPKTKPTLHTKSTPREPTTPVTVTLYRGPETLTGSARPVTIAELNRMVSALGRPKPVHHGAPKPVHDPLALTQTPVRP